MNSEDVAERESSTPLPGLLVQANLSATEIAENNENPDRNEKHDCSDSASFVADAACVRVLGCRRKD